MNLVIQHPALSRTLLDSIATELGAAALANSPFAARFAAPAGFDRAALESGRTSVRQGGTSGGHE